MKALKVLALFGMLLWTWCLTVFHMGTLAPPHPAFAPKLSIHNQWMDKAKLGIHQLVVEGNAYARGYYEGQVTQTLLEREERELTDQLFHIVPKPAVRLLELPLIRYFVGIDKQMDSWMLDEMYGVSRFAPKEYDELIDGYTRQLVYHGLHEVGQMMVDQVGDNFGCTVVAAPLGPDWVLGRNFDFEGSRTLDTEKIVKWVFPDRGSAYVSIIWAGMVGGVTGVNEHGLYLSINAAGSRDRSRFGLPTTLLLVKVLNEATSAESALKILSESKTFITDIFVLLDSKTGQLYRIEKSPKATEILPLRGPSAVTNHLIAPRFRTDRINLFRENELTSSVRLARAEQRLHALPVLRPQSGASLEREILSILRDKGVSLPLGNRQAIDPLIATHAVVYNSKSQVLFVSQGPSLVGPLIGFDLPASFKSKTPIVAGRLPADQVSETTYQAVHLAREQTRAAHAALNAHDCLSAKSLLEQIEFKDLAATEEVFGDFHLQCELDKVAAQKKYARALALDPAYPADRRRLKSKRGEAL